jgi:hypothetical protein
MPPNDEASTKSVYVCCACADTYECLFYSSCVEPDGERNRLTNSGIIAIRLCAKSKIVNRINDHV